MSAQRQIIVEVEASLTNEEIEAHLLSDYSEYENALDMDVGQGSDSRLTIDEISIDAIHVDEAGITINYTLQYSAYYGCDDANFADEDQRSISGTRIGNRFLFVGQGYPEERDPDAYDAYIEP